MTLWLGIDSGRNAVLCVRKPKWNRELEVWYVDKPSDMPVDELYVEDAAKMCGIRNPRPGELYRIDTESSLRDSKAISDVQA